MLQEDTNSVKKSKQSCDECRHHKLKCSRDLPSCNKCFKKKKECKYTHKLLKRGPKPSYDLADLAWHRPGEGYRIMAIQEGNLDIVNSETIEAASHKGTRRNKNRDGDVTEQDEDVQLSVEGEAKRLKQEIEEKYSDSKYFSLLFKQRLIEKIGHINEIEREEFKFIVFYFSILNPSLNFISPDAFLNHFAHSKCLEDFLNLIKSIRKFTNLCVHYNDQFLAQLGSFDFDENQVPTETLNNPALLAKAKLEHLSNLIHCEELSNFL